ncbi:hypothetical protein HPULCUR_004033 [Helicostylum pulchrum]|uniref:Uncharacterized protein n=1 Tax=Helicostylum pulchrum TaxID=562976 RepID=A0ABP9XV34_9FUNG
MLRRNNSSSCEEYNVDTSCFLIGSAAQSMNPPGLFDINTSIEQVQNLCWKLALSLQHSASPKLLETFEPEVRIKTDEAMHASATFTNLIGDYYKESTNNLNASHSRDLAYQLQRFKSCFVGNTPFTANILNNDSNGDDILPDDTSSTPSFEFMGPHLSNNGVFPPPFVTAGFLAPNAKLKPYTLFQLLLISSSSQQQTIKPTLTPSTIKSIEEIKNVSLTKDLKNRRTRSNSVTTINNLSSIWSSIPLFQKSSSSSNSGANKKRFNNNNNNNITATTSTSTATPSTALISPDRWKSIKPNHLQLLDRIQSFNKNSCTFTILIFCGSITETQERTRNFVKLLESPMSFIHRYERAHSNRDTNNRNSTVSLNSPTAESFYQSSGGGRQSLDQPRRDSFESFVDPSRFSTSTMSSSSTYNHHPAVSNALFSVLFISSSARSEAVKYFNNTPPATVHSTFPSGLTQVFLDHDGQCYKAYNVGKQSEVIVIRPDGYIGTRAPIVKEEEGFERVSMYFDSFLRPPVDMNTAAAVVAAGYDC